MKKLLSFVNFICAQILIMLIYLIRPMLGPSNICPYTIGCTQFALMQLETQPIHIACQRTLQRLLTCHPFR